MTAEMAFSFYQILSVGVYSMEEEEVVVEALGAALYREVPAPVHDNALRWENERAREGGSVSGAAVI